MIFETLDFAQYFEKVVVSMVKGVNIFCWGVNIFMWGINNFCWGVDIFSWGVNNFGTGIDIFSKKNKYICRVVNNFCGGVNNLKSGVNNFSQFMNQILLGLNAILSRLNQMKLHLNPLLKGEDLKTVGTNATLETFINRSQLCCFVLLICYISTNRLQLRCFLKFFHAK